MRDIQRGRQRGMGTGRWDDESRWESRSPRSRRPDGDERSSRMGARGMRDDARGGGAWDRPSRGGGSRYPRRDVEEDRYDGGRGGSYGSRGSRGGSPDRSGDRGDRSMRGRRPPMRDDWDGPARGRGGPGPAGSSGSSRRPQPGGGLWGDEGRGPRGRPGVRDPRDPRSPRGGRSAAPEPEKGQLNFAKSMGIVGGMFLLGVAVAFVFFMVTRPTPHLDNTPTVPTSTTAPDLTPTAAPNATPSPTGRLPGTVPAYAFVLVGAGQPQI